MARAYIIVAMICFFGLASAEPNNFSPFIYPVEHQNDIEALQKRADLNDFDLQVVPNDQNQQSVVAYDPADVSLLGLIWDYLPSPITAIKSVVKAIISKVWAIAKFLLPVELVLLGMSLVLGFCAFTPYCTMIIEEPIASKIRAIRSSVPYIDELEYYVNEAINKVQELQVK